MKKIPDILKQKIKHLNSKPYIDHYLKNPYTNIKNHVNQLDSHTQKIQNNIQQNIKQSIKNINSNKQQNSSSTQKGSLNIHYNRQNAEQNNNNNTKILNILNEFEKSMEGHHYIPTAYLKNAHLQSVYQISNSRNDKVTYFREIYTFKDQGICSLDWAYPLPNSNPENHNKILFILHGLTGGSNMNYVKYVCQQATKQGYLCVAYNSRGINTQLTTPVPFSGNKLDDLYEIIQYIQQKYKNHDIFGIGTSFGGNMLMRYCGETQENSGLKGLIGLAVPFAVQRCVDSMGKLYEHFLVDRYKANIIKPHLDMLRNLEKTHNIDLDEVMKTPNLQKFHQSISLKIFGYDTVQEYFDESDVTEKHIQGIKIPTLLMQSLDDPIVSENQIPKNQLYLNSNIIYVDTPNGAHCCWFTGNKKPKRWYPTPVLKFCKAISNQSTQ